MALSVRQFCLLVGPTSVARVAQKLGATSHPLSIGELIRDFGLPLRPENLHLAWLEGSYPQHSVDHPADSVAVPVDSAGGVTLNWEDPGAGSQRAATLFNLSFRQGNGPTRTQGFETTSVGEPLDYLTAYSWNVASRNSFGDGPSTPVFIFMTQAKPQPAPKPAPPPQPPAPPPPDLPGISMLSLYNCQIDKHTVFVWVRDVTGNGPWGRIQQMTTQYNAEGRCPYDENSIVADSTAILTKRGEGGGFACYDGNVYQVSIVDPDRPTCEGRNDPTIGNCVVEDSPSFFKFSLDGPEVVFMLEDGRLKQPPPF